MAYGKISSKQREILEYIKQEFLTKVIRLQFVRSAKQFI